MTYALIVIDMQQGSFGVATPRHDAAGVIRRLNRLAAAVREQGGAVVFVQHDGPPGDPHHPDAPGWRLLSELDARAGDAFVRKAACDSFLGTSLDDTLRARAARTLIVAGCATDYCVDTTVRSALARGWPTIVPADGHTTSDRPHLAAAKIIGHHNAIWADFLAPAGPAHVKPTETVIHHLAALRAPPQRA
ncbi:MAG: cysteine hydrolase [Alphaproteobacteria bacterium]|nr:cysteine hydrolase [Alphaproteobacteria bacterium]